MQFTDLKLELSLQKAIAEMGFTTPTPIQEAAIPVALLGGDLIGTASTGTGKTVAFVLPILQRLLTSPRNTRGPRALILTPTRELAEQIQQAIVQLTRFCPVRSASVYGGVAMGPQERAIRAGVEILVACPGRLLDHMDRGNLGFANLEVLVLDEADRMLDMGFLPAVKRILSALPPHRQTLLFSATFASELDQLAARTLKQPVRVEIGTGAPAHTVAHALLPVEHHQKTALLLELLKQVQTGSVLIFTRTKHRADRLAQQLNRAGHGVAVLHAGRSQGQRQTALDGFRSGRFELMVATDIAARGIDVEGISHVINYDIPDTVDTYVHRIGRTGRAEREGDALTLVTSEDRGMVRAIERVLDKPIERRMLPGFAYDQPAPGMNRSSGDGARGGHRSSQGRGQGGWRSNRGRSGEVRGNRPESVAYRRPPRDG